MEVEFLSWYLSMTLAADTANLTFQMECTPSSKDGGKSKGLCSQASDVVIVHTEESQQ